jgi:hypothetical protein
VEEFFGDTKYLGGWAMEMKPKIAISLNAPLPSVAGKDIGPKSSLTDNNTIWDKIQVRFR